MKKEFSPDMKDPIDSEGPLTPKEEFVLRLVYLRDDWDKGPGARDYSKTDGHAQWYLSLILQFLDAEEKGIMPESIKKRISEFNDWYVTDYGKRPGYPIVDDPAEISQTKDLIQDVITAFKPEFDFDDLPIKDRIKERLIIAKTWFGGIPDRIVHSIDGPWKVRMGWFLGLAAELSLLVNGEIISGETKESADEYLKWWKSLRDIKGEIFFTKEDIDRGDAVIDKVVADLSGESET